MIEVNEKPRRSFKRKFEENGRTQPKETLLDMSVSKLAKAQTRVNLEPSLRKTVMIVNTIRKLEHEIEIGRTETKSNENPFGHCPLGTSSPPDTRPLDSTVFALVRSQNCVENVEKRTNPFMDTRKGTFVCQNNPETSKNRCLKSSACDIAKSEAKSCPSDETFIDLTKSTEMKFKNRFEANSLISGGLTDSSECEINFAEVDISLYDFDLWADGGPQILSTDESSEVVFKPSAFSKRCCDDLKLGKSSETTFADDLDQIMQVLVGI